MLLSLSGEGNKENYQKDVLGIIKASSKKTNKVVKANNKSLLKWSSAAVKKTVGVIKKKTTSDGWLRCIKKYSSTSLLLSSKGNRTPQHTIVGVKKLDEAVSPTKNIFPISMDLLAEKSVGSESKSPDLSEKKSWIAMNTGSPEVTVNSGRKNLQTYRSLFPWAWTTTYN
jgi:hypothetical protein